MIVLDMPTVVSAAVGGSSIYILRRIALKIEHRLDQVEDHEKRLAVIEDRCDLKKGEC